MLKALDNKYNISGPRYTSYPTVAYWNHDSFFLKKWKSSLIQSFKESNLRECISCYINVPFCENLFTYCGCNKRITKQYSVESSYIGIDYFATPTYSLYQSSTHGYLHRNFKGYTASNSQAMTGLGVSSISDSWYGFPQNVWRLMHYYKENSKIRSCFQ